MPIPTEYMYILCNYNGYLHEIKQYGPIVHPAKVKKSEAVAMMIAGAPIVVYDPATKMTYPLTLDTMNSIPVNTLIEKPIEETVLNGAPKGAGDLGISKAINYEPKVQINIQDVINEQNENVDASPAKDDTHDDKISVADLINNPELQESDVMWSNYSKSERRQIRAHINSLKDIPESAE